MLSYLHIRNLALVPELELEFGAGFNAVSGETGAGKSLIIGAIQLLGGARATPALIRKGEKSCEISGMIQLKNLPQEIRDSLAHQLEEAGIPDNSSEEESLLLRRVVTESASRAYVNGTLVPAGFLKELCQELFDLHGPHENQTLLLPTKQLQLLDTFAGCLGERNHLDELWQLLNQLRKEKEELAKAGLSPEEQQLLSYQLKEIDEAHLQPQEEEEILQQYRLASSSQNRLELATAASHLLEGGENTESSITEQLGQLLRQVRELAELDPKEGAPLVQSLEEAVSTLQEIAGDFTHYAEKLDLDEEALHSLEERLNLIQRLKRKYGPSFADVLTTGERIRQRLEKIQNRSGELETLQKKIQATEAEYQKSSTKLSQKRKAAAPKLAHLIQNKLRDLGFLKAGFQIELQAVAPTSTGIDHTLFLFSPNPGEEPKELKAIASSGETARVMLAIKTILSEADQTPILIFDEIDANIGGRTAVAVARELRSVGERHQVFSITHLPQIAAAGNAHYLVTKEIKDDRTFTSMRELQGKERIEELVRMMGADPTSTPARQHAEELLTQLQPST